MQAAWNQEPFRQKRRFWFPPIGAGTDKSTFYFYKVRTMQRRHLRREYVSFRHIGNQNPTKAGIPLCHYRHIFSPTVSPCLEKASTHLFPTPSPQLSPLLQFGFNCSVCLLYLALFNPFHRRPAHLRSGVYISSICCSFCLALRWGLAISSVKFWAII